MSEQPNTYRLFVDDVREVPAGWHGARTVSDAIRYLHSFSPIAELSLDHDILFPAHGIDRYSLYSTETFMGIAYYLAALPKEKWPTRIRIHSSNVPAAMQMCSIMGLSFFSTYKLYDPSDYMSN